MCHLFLYQFHFIARFIERLLNLLEGFYGDIFEVMFIVFSEKGINQIVNVLACVSSESESFVYLMTGTDIIVIGEVKLDVHVKVN
jgi:hypothetical protein